jgi:hypothetical protein
MNLEYKEILRLFTSDLFSSWILLRAHYNGYIARGRFGPVSLFNPLSVVKALEQSSISDFWVATGTALWQITLSELMNAIGRNVPLTQNLWRASETFRRNFDLLITQESVALEVDEHTDFKTCCPLNFCSSSSRLTNTSRLDDISDSGLWGLLYYTGYLTVHEFNESLVCSNTTSPF